MQIPQYDVAIVGARCAGASLATFLARAGARVLVIDQAHLPSDQVLSTHTIHPPGMEILDELGIGDAVRTVAPATRVVRIRKNGKWADVPYREGRAEYCPRRERLDGLLQDAAVETGAELHDGTWATAIHFENGRAVGLQIQRGGAKENVRASLVIGADGRRSFVAAQVGAEEYMAYDAPWGTYWAYWDAPDAWWTDEYPFGMYVGKIGDTVRYLFQTDHGKLLIGSAPPLDVARTWRSNPATSLRQSLAEDPVVNSLLRELPAPDEVRGTISERYFFRTAAWPGWVLIDDAGHHKDYVIGDGITEALIQSKDVATAVSAGGNGALQRWWRERDVKALPAFFWGKEEGAAAAPCEFETLIIGKVGEREELCYLLGRLLEHECSPYDALPPRIVLPWLFASLLRGRFALAPQFLAQLRRTVAYQRTLKHAIAQVPGYQ